MSDENTKNKFQVAGLNPMCLNCTRLFKDCKGTYNLIWGGCVYKKVDNC